MAEQKTNWYADYNEHCYVATMQGGTPMSLDAWMIQRADAVLSDLEAMREKYEAMRDAHGITLMARNQDEAELDRLRKENTKLRDYYDVTHSAAGFGYPESSLRGIESNRDVVVGTLKDLDRLRKALEDAQNWLYASELVAVKPLILDIKRALNPQPTEEK